MNPTIKKTERIHSLDSLRASMMLLGLVLHAAVPYMLAFHPLKDINSTHVAYDFLVLIIHSFRMPIFFLVAGFFGALLFYERSPMLMLQNRFYRILLPFLVFLILLTPIINFVWSYAGDIFADNENAFENALIILKKLDSYIPSRTSHLWFLYYLFLITLTTALLALALEQLKKVRDKLIFAFDWIIQRPIIRILFFSTCTFILFFITRVSMIDGSGSLIPNLHSFVYYASFYIVGWFLFHSKHHLPSFLKYDWLLIIMAIILTIIKGLLILKLGLARNTSFIPVMLISSLIVWFFIFGITGLFIRFSSEKSKRMRYLSDSSYWVYLVHFPIVFLIASIIANLNIPSIFKFCIVFLTTVLICYTSYHFFVRPTIIGRFLNGRRYSIKPKNKLS